MTSLSVLEAAAAEAILDSWEWPKSRGRNEPLARKNGTPVAAALARIATAAILDALSDGPVFDRMVEAIQESNMAHSSDVSLSVQEFLAAGLAAALAAAREGT